MFGKYIEKNTIPLPKNTIPLPFPKTQFLFPLDLFSVVYNRKQIQFMWIYVITGVIDRLSSGVIHRTTRRCNT